MFVRCISTTINSKINERMEENCFAQMHYQIFVGKDVDDSMYSNVEKSQHCTNTARSATSNCKTYDEKMALKVPARMDNLMRELKTLKIKSDFCEDFSWSPCIDLVQRSFVPQRTVGMERSCEEKDFKEYRLVCTG